MIIIRRLRRFIILWKCTFQGSQCRVIFVHTKSRRLLLVSYRRRSYAREYMFVSLLILAATLFTPPSHRVSSSHPEPPVRAATTITLIIYTQSMGEKEIALGRGRDSCSSVQSITERDLLVIIKVPTWKKQKI